MIPDTAAELERVQKLLAELQVSADQEEWYFHNGVCEEEYHADLRKYAAVLGELSRMREAAQELKALSIERDDPSYAHAANIIAAAALAPAPEERP